VLACLADRADAAGRAWPSVRELASRTALAPRSVRRILERLSARGLLSREVLKPGDRTPRGFAVSRWTTLVTLTLGSVVPLLRSIALGRAFLAGGVLTTLQRVLVCLIEGHANAQGWAYPSYSRLALMAGCSERAIVAAVAALRRAGWVETRLCPPGDVLPGGAAAVTWRTVLRVKPDPGPSFRDPRTLVPRPPDPRSEEVHHGSPSRKDEPPDRPPGPLEPPNPVPGLLLAYGRICETDDLGADAGRVLACRLADGCSLPMLRAAMHGIKGTPWRMEYLSRRRIGSTLGSLAKARDFAKRGGWVEAEAVDHAAIAAEDAAAAELRAAEAIGRVQVRRRLQSLTGGLVGQLGARPAF